MSVRYLSGAWVPASSTLVASFGGPDVLADLGLLRAFVRGPSGSTLRLYIGNDVPARLLGLPQHEVDYDLVGSETYGSWSPPLELPAGWWAAFAWSGGSTSATSTGTVRLQYEEAF